MVRKRSKRKQNSHWFTKWMLLKGRIWLSCKIKLQDRTLFERASLTQKGVVSYVKEMVWLSPGSSFKTGRVCQDTDFHCGQNFKRPCQCLSMQQNIWTQSNAMQLITYCNTLQQCCARCNRSRCNFKIVQDVFKIRFHVSFYIFSIFIRNAILRLYEMCLRSDFMFFFYIFLSLIKVQS